ncbi:MAG TPA: sugar phosphate nucleotidyltransferase [Candidatus Absconditabacterales bacterium]|nr:sugar phosphate nucleotidyltransferase [Candidatus Absconditabacterales bacterium]
MKAIIVAAGFGTRTLPINKTIPKEMLPVGDKPVIQYCIEDISKAGIKDVIMITSKYKKALEDYFDRNFELEQALEKSGKNEILEKIIAPTQLANYTFIRQLKALGTGHAVFQTKPWIKDDYFMVIFPDCIYPTKMFEEMMNQFNKNPQPIIACHKVPMEEVYKYGIVSIDENKNVKDFVEKPKVEDAPGNLIRNGVAILPYKIFDKIEETKTDGRSGETHLPDAIKILKDEEDILAMEFQPYKDIGNIQSWMEANNKIFTDGKLFD